MLTTPKATDRIDNQWDGLRPQNVVQAAREDIARRKRNEARADPNYRWAPGEVYEQYAFLRVHVENADGPFGLIEAALEAKRQDRLHPKDMFQKEVVRRGVKQMIWVDPSLNGKLRRSTKPHLIHLYNEALLRAALEMEKAS